MFFNMVFIGSTVVLKYICSRMKSNDIETKRHLETLRFLKYHLAVTKGALIVDWSYFILTHNGIFKYTFVGKYGFIK